ncbi:MAG: UbiA-like polyprenyltransferase [Phycisphaeraceae bacterium]
MTSSVSTPTVSFTGRVAALAQDIKLAHSVFALPFALLATFLAAGSAGRLPTAVTLGLIVLCMFTARTVAMAINRWADASMDAANPRTAQRAIPRGVVSREFVLGAAIACGIAFIVAASGFYFLNDNPWPVLLSPVVLAYLAAYSFTKRITWLCHVVLGGALALSPIAAVIAVEPGYLGDPAPWLLAGVVVCWVAGFDVLYALQDLRFDREAGVFSMPANLGVGPALWISRGLHALVVAGLVALVWRSDLLGVVFAVAAGLAVVLLVFEHALVWAGRTQHMKIAFGTLNGIISVALGAAGIVDVVVGVV